MGGELGQQGAGDGLGSAVHGRRIDDGAASGKQHAQHFGEACLGGGVTRSSLGPASFVALPARCIASVPKHDVLTKRVQAMGAVTRHLRNLDAFHKLLIASVACQVCLRVIHMLITGICGQFRPASQKPHKHLFHLNPTT
jgi:hypothetical protein